ncbi:MAG: bacillithiol system redox-active protein YtxJ [Flavobacteriales bacterium]
MNWLTIESLADLNKAVEGSSMEGIKAVLIFKHSTRCSISSTAKFRLESKWENSPEIPAYYLDLIKYRDISNQIASDFLIHHESPQVIVLKNGKCVYHASHLSISVNDILGAIKN